jgi:ABC-2 family transporter protein
MTWLTWRQFRTQTWVAIGALVAIGVTLVVAAAIVADLYASSGASTCQTDCQKAVSDFLEQVSQGFTGVIYTFAILAMYILPALIGAFWGAPLVARELEAGTHRLAWNQSVTRTRWLATKLAIVGGASMVTMGLLSLGVTWYSHRIDQGTSEQIQPNLFGARGIVPVAYAAFAFGLGVAAGVLIRRTIPAMAATLAVYIAAVAAMPAFFRQHLLPATHVDVPLLTENIHGLGISGDNRELTILTDANVSGWVVSNKTVTPAGLVFTGPADPQYCGRDTGPRTCFGWLGTLNLRQSIDYHPGTQFWALQWVESGIFLALAAALVIFCLQWTKRLT